MSPSGGDKKIALVKSRISHNIQDPPVSAQSGDRTLLSQLTNQILDPLLQASRTFDVGNKTRQLKIWSKNIRLRRSQLWNALPVHIRSEEDVGKFKGLLKTLLFNETEDLKKRAFKYN